MLIILRLFFKQFIISRLGNLFRARSQGEGTTMETTDGQEVVVVKKSTGALVGAFFVKHWKAITIIALMVIEGLWVFSLGNIHGATKTDEAWKATYNASVDAFNQKIKDLQGNSKTVADSTDKSLLQVGKNMDDVQTWYVNQAQKAAEDRQKAESLPGALKCPNEIDLNGKLPDDFWQSWNKLNDAGSVQNPYK